MGQENRNLRKQERRTLNLPKWLTGKRFFYYCVFFVLAYNLGFGVCAYQTLTALSQTQVKTEPTPYDYRHMGPLGVVIINCTWIGHPLANVTARLYTSNLTLVDEQVTNKSGLAAFTFPSVGTFFVRLEYHAYFKQGGVEIVHRWITVKGDPTSPDSFTLNWSIAPAIWPDEPPKL